MQYRSYLVFPVCFSHFPLPVAGGVQLLSVAEGGGRPRILLQNPLLKRSEHPTRKYPPDSRVIISRQPYNPATHKYISATHTSHILRHDGGAFPPTN